MANRVFLHVGTPKTGTTYLQSVLWANKEALKQQGLLLPLSRVREHFYLSNIARDDERPLETMPPHGHTAWERMLTEVGDWDRDALISHELFALCSADRAKWATDSLGTVAAEVHVIVTARDLARQVPAEWQQTIKHGRAHRLSEFYEDLRSEEPTVVFWRVQDLPGVLARWATGVPEEHVHLVTVPPTGAPRDLLWNRFATLIGVDPGSVDASIDAPNESLGVDEVETLRRINLHAPTDEERPRQQLLVRQVLAEGILAARANAQRFAPPTREHPWVVERGTQMVQELRRSAYDVVGDLDELLPPPEPPQGPQPDEVDDKAVAQVAVETVSAVLYRTHELETQRLGTQLVSLQQRLASLQQRLASQQERLASLQERLASAQQQLKARTERVAKLEQRVKTLEERTRSLQQQLAAARQAFREERAQPLTVHLRRRAGLVKRKLLRQPLP